MMQEQWKLQQSWRVVDCPCGDPCSSAMIEPNIVTVRGVIDRSVAEYIVQLHNAKLEDSS
jgi:hypothetical protein